jgi:hypothetical protein
VGGSHAFVSPAWVGGRTMCDDDAVSDFSPPTPDPAADPVLAGPAGPAGQPFHPSRRLVLGAMAGLAVSPFVSTGRAAAATSGATFSGLDPVISAMHVHASWSEGTASWEAQYAQAAALGVDLLYLTDHDFRARAYNYMKSLNGITMVTSRIGTFAQSAATNTTGTIALLAESNTTTPATIMSTVQDKPDANNRMRTSIAGHKLTITFPSCRLNPGATLELRVQMSIHPAYGTRPAGQFELRYRFGAPTAAKYVDATGLIGYVTFPTPTAGASLTVDLTADCQALWPDMLAVDNAIRNLSLAATSPKSASVADVQLTVNFQRSRNNPASLIALQQSVMNTYGPRYPSMSVWPSVEISRLDPHVIPFGVAQFWPEQPQITPSTVATWYPQMVADVHAQGGVVSWNHPFGATGGPLLPQAQQDANRRSIFASMMANGRYGTDTLEVGYPVRGGVNLLSHVALWDTFSRWGVFITGTGVNDDHGGQHWATLNDGFMTGIWSDSVQQPDVVYALLAGRAYTYHAGKWPNAVLDMLADNSIPMGRVVVASKTSRTLTIQASQLPASSRVEVVVGPVDYTGNDPGTHTATSIPAATFGASGLTSVSVDTTKSCFARVQVRNSGGYVIGVGNPIWFLTAPPPGGIPAARLGLT